MERRDALRGKEKEVSDTKIGLDDMIKFFTAESNRYAMEGSTKGASENTKVVARLQKVGQKLDIDSAKKGLETQYYGNSIFTEEQARRLDAYAKDLAKGSNVVKILGKLDWLSEESHEIIRKEKPETFEEASILVQESTDKVIALCAKAFTKILTRAEEDRVKEIIKLGIRNARFRVDDVTIVVSGTGDVEKALDTFTGFIRSQIIEDGSKYAEVIFQYASDKDPCLVRFVK
jgi:hypothetical protein